MEERKEERLVVYTLKTCGLKEKTIKDVLYSKFVSYDYEFEYNHKWRDINIKNKTIDKKLVEELLIEAEKKFLELWQLKQNLVLLQIDV